MRGGEAAVIAALLCGLAGCAGMANPAPSSTVPSPPVIRAAGIATEVRIYEDHIRYEFADGAVHEVTDDHRHLGDGPGSGLVVIGSDEEGPFVATFPTQGGLPPDCYRENGTGVERGPYIELWGILFEKAPTFTTPVQPPDGAEYPAGVRFCLNERALVSTVIGADVQDPTRFESWTFAPDRRTVTVGFIGGREFDPADPCTVAYRGTAEVDGAELVIGVYPERHPVQLPENTGCTAEGHGRSLALVLPRPFDGCCIRDVAGQLFFLEEPPGLVEITGLPEGWLLRAAETLPESPTGRWARIYAPPDHPVGRGSSRGQAQLIQAFDGPANVSGGELQPDVRVNGRPATFYLWEPAGEMVLVWRIGADGVALIGNLADFTTAEFIALAESVMPSD